ncbi:phosphate ABC transporter substrate-binding protein PstS [Modestobacter sp. I12A-02628]|uniref:Phosphate-binding protein n=1 Tax=Goekera deserti TaxID=2497753 RepID=A0A7K3W989_9ACTN|nr:phosphate ABC transporter substrate-binding protein PstS [Goekera deserti]MPR00427.1 phosphate ABC transporter substrate-binding protein PstS [Goekera deserti]NDI49176.1 phosphate ABC transporter substrate-binding protein PstS [Goekera deserti]NEL52914.1 phosphate ABC transporter substrate-binding protein PstS [Goekera deserti]
MKLSTKTRAAGVTAALATSLVLSACGASNEETSDTGSGGGDSTAAELSGSLVGAGASSQQSAMEAWQAGFQGVYPDVQFSYDPAGSGAGREQFIEGRADFAGSDAALDEEELTAASERCAGGEVFELPNYISPIAVLFNLEGVDSLNLTPATIAGIFAGTITTWNDPAIAADNPDATLPSTAITPVHRADDSGTTDNFTDYLFQAAPDVWTSEPDGVWPLEGGESAQGTSGVVEVVTSTDGAVTYADASRAGELGVASVAVGGEFAAPTPEAAAAVVENSPAVEGRGEYDFAIEVNRLTEGSGEYPIVLVSYHVGCIEYDDKEKADNVKAFMNYVISADGQATAAENAGNAEISDSLREQAQTAVDAITTAG